MKKFSVVLLSMLLLFSVTQAAFAQSNYVGAMVGGSKSYLNSSAVFAAGAELNYNLSPKFSINGKALLEMNFEAKTNFLASQINARYKVLELLMINAGLSLGVNVEHFTELPTYVKLTAGIFADANIIGSLSIYGDAKIVLAQFSPEFDWFPKANDEADAPLQFAGSVGLMYKVLPMVGIKGEVGYQGERTFFTVGAGLVF